MLRLDQVDVDMIETALDSQDWPGGYLDPESGDVYPAFQGEVIGDDGDPLDADDLERAAGSRSHPRDRASRTWTWSTSPSG